jgi:hypothetical protein
VAAHLSQKNIFNELGPKARKMRRLDIPCVKRTKNSLQGEILYFDYFGNAITNIRYENANREFWKKAKIYIKEFALGELRPHYSKTDNTLIALLNSSSHLEIAMPGGSAQEAGGLEIGDEVRVIGY